MTIARTKSCDDIGVVIGGRGHGLALPSHEATKTRMHEHIKKKSFRVFRAFEFFVRCRSQTVKTLAPIR